MKLSKRAKRVMLSSDSTAEATVRYLERNGLIEIKDSWLGRTRSSGEDGLPGKKNWQAGQRIYYFVITWKGQQALAQNSFV